MEEFSNSDSNEQSGSSDKDKEEKRKRSPRGFLESYLRAFYPERVKDKKEDDDESLEEPERKSKLEKLWERLFKDKVEVEPVEEAAAPDSAPEKSQTVPSADETAELNTTEATLADPTETPSFSKLESLPTQPQEVTAKIEHTTEPSTPSNETYELRPDDPQTEATAPGQTQPEQISAEVSERIIAMHDGESGSPEHPTDQELKHGNGEDTREREEKRLKREVRRLEETAKDIRAEKEAIKRQQEKFSHDLEKQYKAYEKLHKETLPKLTQSRERLRARLEPEAAIRQMPEALQQIKEAPKRVEAPVMSTQPSNERLMELANVTPVVAPEVVQHTVEHAADHNIAIESAYERRHELKDEPIAFAGVSSSNHGNLVSISHQQASGASIDLRQLTKSASQAADQLKDQHYQMATVPPPSKDLYAQAIKNGFWAAIVLLVFIGLIMLTR
ncbi:MAG TPA: hypothetical protein VLF90_02665 [Patescibacteria group bacterium]|nr:hypothetical protein [Patescibacteria group bacterium]